MHDRNLCQKIVDINILLNNKIVEEVKPCYQNQDSKGSASKEKRQSKKKTGFAKICINKIKGFSKRLWN